MAEAPESLRSIFNGKILLTRLLGKGGFGEVYQGVQASDGTPVAVKIERNTGRNSFLFHEIRVMQEIQATRTKDGLPGIATLLFFGKERDYRILVMALLGESLEDLHRKLNYFSLKTVTLLADQMLDRLEYVHSAGYAHRDLKPDNFVIGRGEHSHRIFMIDFGLSSKYLTPEGKHREMTGDRSFLGTSRFASLRTHQGFSQSRRDDIEQLVYVLIYLYRGRLPWSGLNIKDNKEKEKKIGEIKGQLTPRLICSKCPRQFEDLLYYARNMGYSEAPQYDMCRVLLRSVLDEMKPSQRDDQSFDWEAPPAVHSRTPSNDGVPGLLSSAKANGLLSGFLSSGGGAPIGSDDDNN